MTEVTQVIDNYFSLWNESDPDRRRELISETFTEDASYRGPWLGGTGHEGIETLASELHEHLGEYRFNRVSEIDTHHDFVRYSWEVIPAAGEPLFAAGVDFGVMNPDGRLQSVATFLDVAPVAAGEH
jgi:hypothetical protein